MKVKYYLSSLESVKFGVTRECVFVKRLQFRTGKECALVKVSPALLGQSYGFTEDFELLIIANRHEGESLFPITSFPCFVFIVRPLVENIIERDQIDNGEVEILAWGELYRTKHDAENHVFE